MRGVVGQPGLGGAAAALISAALFGATLFGVSTPALAVGARLRPSPRELIRGFPAPPPC